MPIAWPVTKAASSEARNAIIAATSSGLRHQEGAPGVDPHCEVPGFDRHILDLIAVGALRRPGIVDEDIEPAIAPQHLLDHPPGIRLDADVAERRGCRPAVVNEFLDEAVDAAP